MGWNWSDNIEEGKAIKKDHFQETKEAINDIANDLEVSEFSWEELPINKGDFIKPDHTQELRDATDYIDDWNYCHGENTSREITYYDSEEDNYDGTDRGTYNWSRDSFEDSGEDSGVNGTDRGTYNYSRDVDENSDEDSWRNGIDVSTYESSQCISVYDDNYK